MAKIRTTKLDAAQRQIDSAIRLLFGGEDPLAVHSVAAAGLQIVKDLAKRSDSQILAMMEDRIRPEMRKAWRRDVENRASNFLKHADEDPDAVLEFDEVINDFTIFNACLLFPELEKPWTPEMAAFVIWYNGLWPDHMRRDLPWSDQLASVSRDWRNLSRAEQLEIGREMVAM